VYIVNILCYFSQLGSLFIYGNNYVNEIIIWRQDQTNNIINVHSKRIAK